MPDPALCDLAKHAAFARRQADARKTRLNTSIRFPVELHERLTVAAAEYERPVNWLVVKACEEFLARLLPANEVKWTSDG